MADWKSWKRTFDDLNAMYSESGRHYHTLNHVRDCLEKAKLGKGIATDLDAVEAALWFHDAFYDTRRHDNEGRSAALARERLVRAGVGRAFAENVERMILFTVHTDRPTDVDAQLVVDIDLSSLGSAREVFARNTESIWREYEGVTDIGTFRRERAGVLQSFLDRDPIYLTRPFRDRYEKLARDNLRRSIDELRE